MTLAVGIMLIAAVIVFVAWPFFAPAHEAPESSLGRADTDPWERQKAEAYGAIKEAEFDYRMGKLSDSDYQTLREKYAAKALEAIATIEQAKTTGKKGVTAARRPVRIAFCPQCGHRAPGRVKFCPGCGRALGAETEAVA